MLLEELLMTGEGGDEGDELGAMELADSIDFSSCWEEEGQERDFGRRS